MLDNLWLATSLYAYPSLGFYIKLYNKRLMAFKNISIETFADYDTDSLIDKLEGLRNKTENLSVLKNTVETALSLLDTEKREVIELFYFKNLTGMQIIEKLKIPYNTYRYRKRAGLANLSLYFFMLGMTNERFLAYFDDEQLLVRVCESMIEKNLIHSSAEKEYQEKTVAAIDYRRKYEAGQT